MVRISPGLSMSAARSSPELKAMALGGVEMGRAMAREQAKATVTSTGGSGVTLRPTRMGSSRFAAAVLLITDDIRQASDFRRCQNNDVRTHEEFVELHDAVAVTVRYGQEAKEIELSRSQDHAPRFRGRQGVEDEILDRELILPVCVLIVEDDEHADDSNRKVSKVLGQSLPKTDDEVESQPADEYEEDVGKDVKPFEHSLGDPVGPQVDDGQEDTA